MPIPLSFLSLPPLSSIHLLFFLYVGCPSSHIGWKSWSSKDVCGLPGADLIDLKDFEAQMKEEEEVDKRKDTGELHEGEC